MVKIDPELIPPIFRYNDIEIPEGAHKISPSQISKFFEYPKLYYLENISGEKENEFQGNTATTLGTICHYVYHCVITGKEINREEINRQLDAYAELRPELGLDLADIKLNYPLITGATVNEYILPSKATLKESEKSVLVSIDEDVYLGGTTDLIEDDMIVDFKTVGKKPDENLIPWGYKIQLLAYAYAFRKQGYNINRIRLVYGVKPTKTIPARCITVTELITPEHEKMIQDTLQLITESVIICRNNPELVYLIFKSMELK